MAPQAVSALIRRALADARVRTLSFAGLFAAAGYANVVGYRSAYPTLHERLGFAHSFGGNDAVRLFYGKPYDLLTVGGYAAWRVAGLLSIFAGVWGFLAAVRALRAEEDSGRAELLLTGIVSRRGEYLAVLAAIGVGAGVLWLGAFLGLALAGLEVDGSAFLALAIVAVVPVFVGVGALASQLAGTRRAAIELSSAVLVIAFLMRVVADTSGPLEWLRWITPLGWVEELRPFTGARPILLLLPAGAGALLLLAAGVLALGRDIGTGLLPARDSSHQTHGCSPPRLPRRCAASVGVSGRGCSAAASSPSSSASSPPASLRLGCPTTFRESFTRSWLCRSPPRRDTSASRSSSTCWC